MAKDKTQVKNYDLSLERVMVQIKNGDKPVVDKDNNPIEKPIFQMHLDILGKKKQFRIQAANEGDIELLKDFFELQGVNVLPVVIETVQFKDETTKRVITRNNVVVRFSEDDDIHVLRLKPIPSEASLFNMAIAEKAKKWVCPEDVRAKRKERYEKVQAKRAQELQEAPKGDQKKAKPKKGDEEDLPF